MSYKPFITGSTLLTGLTITVVTNHVFKSWEMILQVLQNMAFSLQTANKKQRLLSPSRERKTISHQTGLKENHRLQHTLGGDMLVSRRLDDFPPLMLLPRTPRNCWWFHRNVICFSVEVTDDASVHRIFFPTVRNVGENHRWDLKCSGCRNFR